MNLIFSRCLLAIEAEYDPQAPARVLGLITRHNALPLWFSTRVISPDSIRIEMELSESDGEVSERIARLIADIPSVISVSRRLRK